MKKLKLLSSLSALLLVLSVGACDKNAEDDTSEEPTISELENYTLSVSFEADGTVAAIPEYGTAYIIGGWDSWGAFIPLKADDGKYVTTFDTIAVGTHEYKIVMWYTDQDVSWSDCIEITTTNQTLKVEASQGNDFVKEITHTLDVELPEPLTDEQIISGILEEASKYEYADEIGWEAYHYTELEEYWECEGEYYLTQDEEENVYGSAYTSDEGDVTYSYFRGGSKYNYYPDEDPDDQYSKVEFNDVYTYAIEYFLEPFEILTSYGEEDDGLDLDDYTVTVTKEITNYRYTLELVQNEVYEDEDDDEYYCETTYTYTYVCDTHFNLIAVGYEMDDDEEGLTSYFAESVTYEDVEASMSGFNPYQWDIAHSPAELAEQAAITHNYSVQIQYDIYESNSTITYGEYLAALGGDQEALAKLNGLTDDLTIESYLADIYYTENSVLFIESYYNEETEEYERDGYEHVYVNDPDVGIWHYYTEDGYTWHIAYGNAGYSWWNYTYSLVAGYSYADYLEYYTSSDGLDIYYFNSTMDWYYGVGAYWFVYLGGDLFFGDASGAFSYLYYYFYDEGTYFSEEDQTMTTIWSTADGGNLFYDDDDLTENTELFFYEEDMYATVYNVGQTEEDPEVAYWHNYWQNYLANQ